MNKNINSLISVLIIISALVGFVLNMISGEYRLALATITVGLFVWLIVLSILKTKTSSIHIIVTLVGFLAGISVFMDIAIEQDMWGGYHIQPDTALISFVLLLLAMTPGLLLFYFRASGSILSPSVPPLESTTPSNVGEPSTNENVPESSSQNSWNPSEFEVEYDPEMMAAYYEAYQKAEETEI